MAICGDCAIDLLFLSSLLAFAPPASSQTTTPWGLTNLTSPIRSACFPVFHSRYGMWVDPCHHVVHIPRGWHGTLECTGPASGLSIVGARYGPLCQNVSSQNACRDTCTASNAALRAREICGAGQKQRCRIKARDDLFGNPCPDLPTALVISFTCDYYIWNDEPLVGLNGQHHESSSGGAKLGSSADFQVADDASIFVDSSRCRQPGSSANGFSAVGCQCMGSNWGDQANVAGLNLRAEPGRTLPRNSSAWVNAARQVDNSDLVAQKTFRGFCHSNDNPNFSAERPSVRCARMAPPQSATSCFFGENCCQPTL
ncbi:hypothetical protein RvY_19042 [Ramazzottius varieornatus]|uniref:SUEL-type lectin domain-containing protein n=1 Tax=Ramazzottius varieornatus TaxID=947166 RepID=A0A1D1W9B2_RAMVA|nr:hypothetical protein RvY_19042 [Ramazzottius varieornatus]